MVNTGKPSAGCFACKKRRVKCDKQKPHCRRCVKLGRDCPGYQDDWSSKFRQQNDWAEKSVQSRVELKTLERKLKVAGGGSSRGPIEEFAYGFAACLKDEEPQVVQTLLRREAVLSPSSTELVLCRTPFIRPEDYTINLFFKDYVLKTQAPFLDFLPGLYSTKHLKCLDEALPAVSLASSAQQTKRSDLMVEARKHYGRAMLSLASSLRNKAEVTSDDVLLTVYLLGLFEIISADKRCDDYFNAPGHLPLPVRNVHTSGAQMLVQLRGHKQLDTHVGRNLFILVNHCTLIKTFLGREEPSRELYCWSDLPQSWVKAFALDDPIYKASKFCSDIAKMVTSEKPLNLTHDEVIQLIDHGTKIGSSLDQADEQLPEIWPADLVSMEHTGAFDHLSVLWGDVTEGMARNQYRTMRIHILGAICDLLRFAQGSLEQDLTHLLVEMQLTTAYLVERICSTVFFIAGINSRHPDGATPGVAIRAFSLLWPLRTSLLAEGIPEERREWIRDKLRWIAHVTGLGYASVIADFGANE